MFYFNSYDSMLIKKTTKTKKTFNKRKIFPLNVNA